MAAQSRCRLICARPGGAARLPLKGPSGSFTPANMETHRCIIDWSPENMLHGIQLA